MINDFELGRTAADVLCLGLTFLVQEGDWQVGKDSDESLAVSE